MAPLNVVPDASGGVADNTDLSKEDAAKVQEQLDSAIDAAVSGGVAREKANQARQRASEAETDEERQKFEAEAKKYEKHAETQLSTSRRLQSGAWQGFGAGAGIGAATGVGLGGVIGTLSGGILAVPLGALGGLVGAGTGAIHGPWVKLTRGEKGPQVESAKEGEPGAIKLMPEEVEGFQKSMQNTVSQGSDMLKNATSIFSSSPKNKPKPGREPPPKLESGDKMRRRQNGER